jgi:hypothetical protein
MDLKSDSQNVDVNLQSRSETMVRHIPCVAVTIIKKHAGELSGIIDVT